MIKINDEACIHCGSCSGYISDDEKVEQCPVGAVEIVEEKNENDN